MSHCTNHFDAYLQLYFRLVQPRGGVSLPGRSHYPLQLRYSGSPTSTIEVCMYMYMLLLEACVTMNIVEQRGNGR